MTATVAEATVPDAPPAPPRTSPARRPRQPARSPRARTPRPLPAPRPRQPRQPRRRAAGQSGLERAYRRQATRPRGGDLKDYQVVVLIEYVAAIVLVATAPIAKGQAAAPGAGTPGISPYQGKDVLQLGGITLLYLVLALAAAGGRGLGRVSAWLGGLVLLTVGLGQAASIARTLDLFGVGGGPATTAAGGTQGSQAAGGSITHQQQITHPAQGG